MKLSHPPLFSLTNQSSGMEKRPGSPSESLVAKKRRASPSLEKLGMICLTMEEEYKEIRVYVFDDVCSNDQEFKHIKPRVLLRYDKKEGYYDAVCVVDSTLYVFEGFEPMSNPTGEQMKSVWSFVLSSDTLEGEESMRMLEKNSSMIHTKWCPIAIPTPDAGTILVFSANLSDKHSDSDFEMYNISSGIWETLPGLPIRPFPVYDEHISYGYMRSMSHRVESYGFIDKSHFLVETTDGTFTLDLQSKKWSHIPNWDPYSSRWSSNPDWNAYDSWCRGRFITLSDGRIAVTPRGVFGSKNHETLFSGVGIEGPRNDDPSGDTCGYVFRLSDAHLSKFPSTNPPNLNDSFLLPSIIPLRIQDGVFNICTLQAEEDNECDECERGGGRVLIDVSRINGDGDNKTTEVVNTLRAHIYNINDHPMLDLFPLS